jgi:cytoskeletal protein RodZ
LKLHSSNAGGAEGQTTRRLLSGIGQAKLDTSSSSSFEEEDIGDDDDEDEEEEEEDEDFEEEEGEFEVVRELYMPPKVETSNTSRTAVRSASPGSINLDCPHFER